MLKQKYFLTDFFILSAEKQPIKSSWRKIEWLLLRANDHSEKLQVKTIIFKKVLSLLNKNLNDKSYYIISIALKKNCQRKTLHSILHVNKNIFQSDVQYF